MLRGYAILDGAELRRPVLLAEWTRHALSEITVHDLATGERVGQVPLPGLGTVGGVSERPEGGHEAWFGYTDYTTSSVVLRFDARTLRGDHLGHGAGQGRGPGRDGAAGDV